MIRPDLNGFSGACLEILSGRTPLRVRKRASSPAGNARLRRQMEKQAAFAGLGASLRTPEILDCGETDGCFHFDMEYVPGLDGHRFLEKCDPTDLRRFTGQISAFLEEAVALPAVSQGNCANLFTASVEKLLEVHVKNVGLDHALVGRLLLGLDQVRTLAPDTPGFCHGDFTLENIMVDEHGCLWLVDFLDSTFEHPVQDYVKLSQDLLGGWFEMKSRIISPAVQCYLHENISAKISTLNPAYSSMEPILLALNFCRILPYARSQREREFILKRIQRFCHSRP
ncbi:MAG: aminoglycoside phosphotransferase family protein [Luteolibacter sp.]